jgi:hypothetical protein
MQWLDDRSRMSGDVHVRFCEHLRGRYPRVTRLVILTTSEAEAEKALAEERQWMENHQLELHPDKTRIVNETDDPNGFDFLGYTFKKGMRLLRKKSRVAMRDKIRHHNYAMT